MTFLKKTILLAVLLTMMLSTLSFANSAQPVTNPDQSAIYFNPDSGIELEKEVLRIVVDDDLWQTHYQIVYDFYNGTESLIDTPIWFLASMHDEETFKVSVNNEEIESEKIEVDPESISNWSFGPNNRFVTPWDQTTIDNASWYGGPYYETFPVEEFNLSLKVDETVQMTINYTARNGYISKNEYFSRLKTALYYLSPASFYDGDATVDIYLIVPGGTMVGSTIHLEEVSDTEYQSLGVPLGEDDLYLSFLSEEDLFFGTNVRRDYYNVLYMLIAILLAILVVFRKNRKIRRIIILLIIVGLLGFLARPTYGMMFMIMMFGPVVLGILLVIAGVYFYMNRKRGRLG